MNAPAAVSASTDVAIFTGNPVAVLTDNKQADQLFAQIEQEIAAFTPDLASDKGRRAIAALAYKVSRTKTAIDSAGEKLIEEARKTVSAVNEERKKVRDRLDSLRDLARKPLTEWEQAEEDRKQRCASVMTNITKTIVQHFHTSADVRTMIASVESFAIDADEFREEADAAEQRKTEQLTMLREALTRIEQEEADRAELERLRREREERDRAEAERIAREAEERRQREEAEAAERAEQERARIAAEAEARRKAEEEQRARQAEEDRQKAIREAEERARAEEKRKADEEIARLKKAEDDRLAAEKREREEAARREADRAHRQKIMGEAKAAIMTCGADEETAKKIVLAVIAGEIPHTAIRF